MELNDGAVPFTSAPKMAREEGILPVVLLSNWAACWWGEGLQGESRKQAQLKEEKERCSWKIIPGRPWGRAVWPSLRGKSPTWISPSSPVSLGLCEVISCTN